MLKKNKIKNKKSVLLSLRQQNTSPNQSKRFGLQGKKIFALKSVIAFFVLIWFFVGFGFLKTYFKTFNVFGSLLDGEISTVKLYAQNIYTPKSNDFKAGWWNEAGAYGKADVNSRGTMFLFSPENSAFYAGGNYSLYFKNFVPEKDLPPTLLEKEKKIPDKNDYPINLNNQENAQSSSSPEEDLGFLKSSSTEEFLSSDEDNFELKDFSTSTDFDFIETDNNFSPLASSSLLFLDEEKGGAGKDIFSTTSNTDLASTTVSNNGMTGGDISLKSFFSPAQVLADENKQSLKNLGKFKNAKIKISLALKKINNSDNDADFEGEQNFQNDNRDEDDNSVASDIISDLENSATSTNQNDNSFISNQGDNNIIFKNDDTATSESDNIIIPDQSDSTPSVIPDRSDNFPPVIPGRSDNLPPVIPGRSDSGGEGNPLSHKENNKNNSTANLENSEQKNYTADNEQNSENNTDFAEEKNIDNAEDFQVLDIEDKESDDLDVNISSAPVSSEEDLEIDILEEGDEQVDDFEKKEDDLGVETGNKDANQDNLSLNKIFKIKTAQAKIKNARAQSDEEKFTIWYTLDDLSLENSATSSASSTIMWHKLDTVYDDDLSNGILGSYLSYEAPFLHSWEDVEKLKIKVQGLSPDKADFVLYLDAFWLEVDYYGAPKKTDYKDWLQNLSDKKVFGANEKVKFDFYYQGNKKDFLDNLGEVLGVYDFWKKVNISARLFDSQNKEVDTDLVFLFEENGNFTLSIPEMNNLRPGLYKIKFNVLDKNISEEEVLEFEEDFYWGVLAFNVDKSVYSAGESAQIDVAVLDNFGHTLCGAEVNVQIISPSGEIVNLSTENNLLLKNPNCAPQSFSYKGDYYGEFKTKETGEHKVQITAKTEKGIWQTNDSFFVSELNDFSLQRIAPTRIYPKRDYYSKLILEVKNDFKGDIQEFVPIEFKILKQKVEILNSTSSDAFGSDYRFTEVDNIDKKILLWHDLELKKGDKLMISYFFDAPDISPEFYLLGRVKIKNASSALASFEEKRNWQIASDALNKRAKTVMFFAGHYFGDGTTGQNTNTDYTLDAFNFKLAESGVDIKNAYIIFESQFEAYADNGGIYNGYRLSFDACEESCTASAFSGTGRVLKDDSSDLVYDETESNQVRLLLDISNETDIANYTGGGVEMEAQVGYQIKFGANVNSIANAKAILVLTYTYDADSPNLTNTVVYPLESTASGDSGTRLNSVGACTRNSNCPVFDYKMEIPEFPGVATTSYRLSQWFRMHDSNDGNNANDMDPNVNIQGYDVDSNTFHHECANAGTQGNMPNMFFPNWTNSGYAENTAQQLEYYVNSGTNYTIGGEVFETYIASSSAPVKTRTVSFPIGVINNGNSVATSSADVDVYFPENGSATGTISIKKAWLRLLPNNRSSDVLSITVSTKVGDNATSSDYVYNYNGGGSVIRPVVDIYHVIPSSDYSELEKANADTAKKVQVNTTYNATSWGGVSAELMITYTYTNEANGYLSSLNIFAGQTDTNGNDQSETMTTAGLVFPEDSNKTVLAGALHASYLVSDSDGSMGTTLLMDADLDASAPTCNNTYYSTADAMNEFTEFYKDVSDALGTTDSQTYSVCYSNNGAGAGTAGAKMNGQLIYTYAWENNPPTGAFNSVAQRIDGSGILDISIEVDDPDDHDCRAKIEYVAGDTCDFSSPLDPSLDEADTNVTADYGDPDLDNSNDYQIGNSSAYITTASGSNSVSFDWLSKTDLPSADGVYCLRLTVNDNFMDQETPATTTITIDNTKPTSPGALSLNSRTGSSITLNFGATSTETNFKEYKIFYKEYDGADPNESDSVHASSTDSALGDVLFNNHSTTTISGLSAGTTYSFAIWVYDDYGNKASSSRVDIMANDAPTGSFNSASQKTDGSGIVDISIEVDDNNNDDTLLAKLEYSPGLSCDFSSSYDPYFDESSITADFGTPVIDNNQEYQIGSSSGYIITSPGSNTVSFDWLSKNNLPSADQNYCLRLTVSDGVDNQLQSATTTLLLDNVNPISTGDLSYADLDINSVRLIFATSSPGSDTNEPSVNAYRIFYKKGTSSVTVSDTEFDDSALNAYNYNGATSTLVSGLDSNTDYVFNIWTYDSFGNKVSANEITFKTKSTLQNKSLTFTNATSTNVLLADNLSEWNFRAVVSEVNGWYALDKVKLRLADNSDNSSPFSDLEFTWSQSTQSFSETGNDILSVATLSSNSASTCAVNDCTIDFKIVVNKDFASTSVLYDAELYSTNDNADSQNDIYSAFYQVKKIFLEQLHYRWRNDDGGE